MASREVTKRDSDSPSSGSDSESSTDYSSEDSDAEFATPQVDAAILRTIAKIQSKDPSIYESKGSVYEELENQPEPRSKKSKSEKPLTIKDMERMRLLGQHTSEPTPKEAEDNLKAETLAAFHSKSDAGSDSEVEDLLQPRRIQQQQVQEEEDPEMRTLVNSTLAQDDGFLRDFILHRGWVDKDKSALPTHEQIVGPERTEREFEGPTGANAVGPGYRPIDDEEDLDFEDKADAFEAKYNFRFEQDGADQVTSHARDADTLRRTDDARRKEREAKKERKAAAKASKANEVARLKASKRAGILDKIKQIQEVSGKGMQEADLEGDFDEEQHQKMMQNMFDEEWYGQDAGDDADGKPQFDDDIDTAAYEEQDHHQAEDEVDKDEEAYDPTTVGAPKKKSKKERKKEKKEKEKDKAKRQQQSGGIEDSTANAVAGPSALSTSAAVDSTEQALERLPEDQKRQVQSELDEYYGLDYEDMIGDDLPTRFKYTQVEPETYGLSASDILMLTDKELNAYVSLKKLAPYRHGQGSGDKRKTQGKKLRDLKGATKDRQWGNALPMSRAKQVDLSKYSASPSNNNNNKRKREDQQEGAEEGEKPKKRMGKKERARKKAEAAQAGEGLQET